MALGMRESVSVCIHFCAFKCNVVCISLFGHYKILINWIFLCRCAMCKHQFGVLVTNLYMYQVAWMPDTQHHVFIVDMFLLSPRVPVNSFSVSFFIQISPNRLPMMLSRFAFPVSAHHRPIHINLEQLR